MVYKNRPYEITMYAYTYTSLPYTSIARAICIYLI